MFSSFKDDSSCFNSQPLLENRGQPPFLSGTTSKQTSGPPWDYSQQTFSTVPFYSGDNLNHRHPVVQNPNTVPHMENSSLLSNYNKNVISGSNIHQSVVRPRAVINCQTNCEACYSHSFTRFPQSWGAASSECVRYGGGSSITSLPSDDIPRFPPNFPQTDDCSNRFGGDFSSSLNKLSRFSKDAQGITASIPKKNITSVTDSNILGQQNHSRSTGISEQYISSLAVDDAVAKTEVCHIACRGMCGQSSCKIYKCSLTKSANLNSTPAQQYGMPRENVVRYTGHAAGVTGGSRWHTQNHQPSRLWLPKGHPPGIWIPPQEPVNSFEHSNAPSFWGERDTCDMPSQQFQSQNYEMSSSYKSANQMKTVQNISYKESMGGVHEERTEKNHERIPFHDSAADISRHSADVVKRRPEDLSTSEHAGRYMEASQRMQQKCDNTGTLFNQDLHYQKPTGRNVHLPSKSYPETEVNKEKCRDPTSSTVLLLQNATKALLNSNETIQNYTSPLDPHNDISRKYSFSAPVGNYSTYQNHDGKFHSPVLGIAQPPSRFGSHLTYTHSKISRNSNGIFPDTYVESSRPLSCQLPSDNDSFLNQHMSYDPNKDYSSNVIHCPVQNPDAIGRCGSVKDTVEAVAPQMTLQSYDKITNPNVTGYFGTSTNMHEMDSTSKSGNVNPAAYNRDSVVINSFQDSAHNGFYQSSGSTFAPNAFINELNYPSKRYTNVPVISRSDKETCHISTAYDTSYSQNSPLASEGSPDRPIKKRKSRVRNVDNMEKRMDNSRNNHILDVRQFLETWDEEMDLSPAPRLPDVVLSSNSAENPLLVLDCRQLSTNGVATLSAVDRSTGNLIQTYQEPLECPSENNEISKHPEQQFNGCASLLPLNPLEEISKLCDADQKSDTKINRPATPDSEIASQEMPLSNLADAGFSLNDGVNGVDTCGVSDGVIQELLLPSQKFENTKTDEKTNISDFNPLCDCELNKGRTPTSACSLPHSVLQVAENELADPCRDYKDGDNISDLYSSSHFKQGATNLKGRTNNIPEMQNSTSEAVKEHLKKSRIQTLKQLCEYVLQQHGTSKHCFENGSHVTHKNSVPLYMSDSKPTAKLSSMPDAAENSINVSVQDTCKVQHRQTVEQPYLLNDSPNDKGAFETDAHSEEDNILGSNKVELHHNELWVKHTDVEKQTCSLGAKAEITVRPLEDKSFKQNAEEENEKPLKDKLKEGNNMAEESCELRNNIAKISDSISSVITTEVSRNKSKKEQKSQNSDMHAEGDILSGEGNLKSILTNKEPEFKIILNKNQSNKPCFGIDAVEDMDFSQPTFNTVKEESEVPMFSNSTEKSDNCESILISTMRSNISSVLANSGSEGDDRYDLDMSVTSSIHSDLDIEQSQPQKIHSVEITYDESNEFFDSDVMDAEELMHSNMTEASDIICCSSAFETSCCKIDDTKGYEKIETKTNQYKDDFSLLGDSPKLELAKCSDQTSEVILPDKLIGKTLVEKSIRSKKELQSEKENISKLQKCSSSSLDENLNVDGNIVLNTLKKIGFKSNGNNAACAQTGDMARSNEESVEELHLDENQNQSSSAKLKIAVKDLYDDADEVLQNSVKAEVNSIENIHVHSECSEESTTIANDCGLPSMTITKPSAKVKDVAEVSTLFNKSTKVHGPSQKSDKPAFESLEIEYVHLADNEISNTVANVSIMATTCKPESKDCSEFSNFSDAFIKENVPLQESFDLLVDPLEDVHVDFKCATASTMVPNGCSVTSALITKSNHEAKDYSELPYCSDTSEKEDEFLQKSDKLSFKALENLNNLECTEISTTSDCDLPNTIITKSKLKTQDNSDECNVPDTELALNYDSEERQNKPNIASGNSLLTAKNSCELVCDSDLQKNCMNNEFKQNTMNINPPDLLHNVLHESHDESEQDGANNIKKLINNEKRHIGCAKNLAKKISEGAVSEVESKKVIIDSVFPQVSVNRYTAVSKPTDLCYKLDNNNITSLLINKDTNQEEKQSKIKSKREYIEQTNEKELQALKVMDNCLLPHCSESNSQHQNSNAYCRNNHKGDLEVSDSCEGKSVTYEKIYTKYSEGCLCFTSSVIKKEGSLQKDKLSCINVCRVGQGQMASSRIKTNNPSENEIIVNNALSSALQKYSNFDFIDENFHAKDNKEEEKEANLGYRNIHRSGNAFIRKLQNINSNILPLRKLRCASKLLSKSEININTHCHAVLKSTVSLKNLSITKANNLDDAITDRGNMSLKSTHILQRRFSEPLVRTYGCDIRNKIKLRTCVSVTDLNCAYLSDTLAEILRKNKLQIIVKLSTCNSRSGTNNNAIMELHKAYSHFLNGQASGYHCIEYLDPTSKALLQKNKNVLKRKISQCISDDEPYHSFHKDPSKTKKKRDTEGNCCDSEKDKLSTSAIVEARMADKSHINKKIMPSDLLSSLKATREVKNTTISLTFVDNNEPLFLESINKTKYDGFITEEVVSKLNTGIPQSNICVETKASDYKKTSNIQYILEVSSTGLGLKGVDIDEKLEKKSVTQFNQSQDCILNLSGSRNTSLLVGVLPSLGSKCSTFQVAGSVEDESKVERITQKSNISTHEIQEVEKSEGSLAVESEDSAQICFEKDYALCTQMCEAAVSSNVSREIQGNEFLDKINKSSLADNSKVCANHVESLNMYSIFASPVLKNVEDTKYSESARDILTTNNHQQGNNSDGIQEWGNGDKCENTCIALMQRNIIVKGNDENDQRKLSPCLKEFQEDDILEKYDHVAGKIQDAMAVKVQDESVEKIHDAVAEKIPDNDLTEQAQDDLVEKIQDDDNQNGNNFELIKSMEERKVKQLQRTEETNLFENSYVSVKLNHFQRKGETCVPEKINDSGAKQERGVRNNLQSSVSQSAEEEIIVATQQKQEIGIKRIAVQKSIEVRGKEAIANNINEVLLLRNIQKVDDTTVQTINDNVSQDNVMFLKNMTPSNLEMADIHYESREFDKALKATVDDRNNIPVSKTNTGNIDIFMPVGNNVYKQTEVSYKNKKGKQGNIQSLCDLHCISNVQREKVFDKPLVSHNHMKVKDDSCCMTAMQEFTLQESVCNDEKNSKMEISFITHNTTITDEAALVIKPKSKNCSNLESHQLCMNKAVDRSTGPTVLEFVTGGNRLGLLPVIKEKNFIARNVISDVQKAEESRGGTDDIAAKIETTPALKVGAQTLILMHRGSSNSMAVINELNTFEGELPINNKFLISGSFSDAMSIAPKASILRKDNCSYSLKHTTDCMNSMLVSLTVHKIKILKEIANSLSQNLMEIKIKTEDFASAQVTKHENYRDLRATKGLNFCGISWYSTDLAAHVADQEKAKNKLKCTIQNKIKCSSSSCSLKSPDYVEKGTRSSGCKVNISLRAGTAPDLFDLVKKNKIIEERVAENNSMENVHDVDAYVDMPHLEAISTEISSNDSETEMPCLELIDNLEPMDIDHVQELGETSTDKENAEHYAVEETTKSAGETKQEKPSEHAKISVNVNSKLSPNPESCEKMQNSLEEANNFQQVYLEIASKERSPLNILKGESPVFIDSISTTLKVSDKEPEAEAPIDYSVPKSVLRIVNQNAQSTCESSLKLCRADTDGWHDLGFPQNYSPQSDNSERIVNKEMHFSNKEKFFAETEPPTAFPICTESSSIPLQILESEAEYMHCMNELNSKECWTSGKIIGDNRYIAEEETCDFNPPSQVCSDVLMSNCESELNIQESLELDIPSLGDSVPSQLEPPEIGSSLGDVIPADFVTNWPYLEEEVLCEADNTLCSVDSEYQTVHSSSPVEQCLPSDLNGTVNSSALDSNRSSVHNDSALLGELKCRLSWKKIFNFSKLDRKQRKKFKKVEKEDIMVTSVNSAHCSISDIQNKNIKSQNCMPLNYHTDTTSLTSSNKEFGGLELGPAKIEVRIPRSASTKGLPKVWKVVDRSKPFSVPEAQKENTEASGGNLDAIGQGPIVVVKRLILKRGYDNEDVDKTKKRKHSHKKTVKHVSEKDTDMHGLLKHVNTLQVNDTIYRPAYSSETHIAKEINEKPIGNRTDDIIMKKNDLRNTNENNSHCSENASEICCNSMPSSADGVLARDILNQSIRTEDIGSENSANNENSSESCSENIFSKNSTDISECTEQQKVSQKIPKVIIKRTVGIDNTNNYRSFLTDGVLSNHARHSWNPVVRLERNASLDSLAKKLVPKNKPTEEMFAQSEVRHGIKINLRSPPGTPAVTIVSLSSAVPINTINANHSHKRRKHLYSRKKRGSALEEQNSSVTSTVLNSSSSNHAQSSLFCPSNELESYQKTIENQVALNQNVTRPNLNNTNNLEDYVLIRNTDCTRKDFTKITFHRHKKKRRKTESNKRKKKSCSNLGHSLNGTSKHTFLNIKNGVQKKRCQLNAFDFSADEGDKNSNSASEKSVSQETEQTAEIFLPPNNVDIGLNERQSTNVSGCINSTSKHHCSNELSDLLLTSPDFTIENQIQKQSFVKSNKKRKRHIEEGLIKDELPLFHPDRILTYSGSSRKKRLKFKEKSQPPDEQELEKEIKDLCLEMALPSPSNRAAEETNTSAGDAPEHDKVNSKVCKNYGSQVAGLQLHNCPEMMCCQVNGHLYEQHEERISHIKQHPFHCQQCHLSFKSEDDFVNHLAEQHPGTRTKHHCLLCEHTFPTAERHKLHLAGQTHRHLELIQRRTIHALFSLFTGHSCPVLEPLTENELAGLNWLPVEPGTIHFYHQSTPLQRVIQTLMCRKERNFANVATATTQRFSPTVPAEEDSTASEHVIK